MVSLTTRNAFRSVLPVTHIGGWIMEPAIPRLLNVAEVAEQLGINPQTIYKSRFLGNGPRAVTVGRRLMFRPSDVNAWLDERHEAAS